MLAVMYSMDYIRQPNAKRSGPNSKRLNVYACSDLGDFTRHVKGASVDPTRPSIPEWAQVPLDELSEAEVLQCDGRIIQPGLKFARRQAVDFCSHDLPGIKDDRPMTYEEWESADRERKKKMSAKIFFEK